jgi:hypothetical protein
LAAIPASVSVHSGKISLPGFQESYNLEIVFAFGHFQHRNVIFIAAPDKGLSVV